MYVVVEQFDKVIVVVMVEDIVDLFYVVLKYIMGEAVCWVEKCRLEDVSYVLCILVIEYLIIGI